MASLKQSFNLSSFSVMIYNKFWSESVDHKGECFFSPAAPFHSKFRSKVAAVLNISPILPTPLLGQRADLNFKSVLRCDPHKQKTVHTHVYQKKRYPGRRYEGYFSLRIYAPI